MIYTLGGRSHSTPHVSVALTHLLEASPAEVLLLATEEAQKAHPTLPDLLGPTARFVAIPNASDEAEQWSLFRAVRALLEAPDVVLDITHGWRVQPFLSSAVIAHVRATRPETRVRVVYGAYDPRRPEAPIWDLTALVDLVEWSHAVRSLRATGRTTEVVALVEGLGARRRKAWNERGRNGPEPRLKPFAAALRAFGDDLATIRTGSLVGTSGSAARVVAELENASPDLADLPPLAPILAELRATLEPLTRADLADAAGDDVLAALARLYLDLDRVPEAVTVAREARISRFAEDWTARTPGTHDRPRPGFDAVRSQAEHRWRRFDLRYRGSIAEVRNTVDHAGFQAKPLPPAAVRNQAAQAVNAILQPVTLPDPVSAPARFLNISNHPVSGWSDAQRDAAQALAGGEVVDIPFPAVPPEAEEVGSLSAAVLGQVEAHPGAIAAMVQGEFVLTATLVHELETRGIRCFAATTTREVVQEGDRTVSRFRFVRFRPYR